MESAIPRGKVLRWVYFAVVLLLAAQVVYLIDLATVVSNTDNDWRWNRLRVFQNSHDDVESGGPTSITTGDPSHLNFSCSCRESLSPSFLYGFNSKESLALGLKGKRDQILVLGMHHSATSPLMRTLVEIFGFNCGGRRNLIMRRDNPLKYWEYRKAVQANQMIMTAYRKDFLSGFEATRGHMWVGWGFDFVDAMAKEGDKPLFKQRMRDFRAQVKTSVRALNSFSRPWVLKDPRLSILSKPWLAELDLPACILLYRNPVESAYRFLAYNLPGNAFTVKEWAAVWEEYTYRSIEACLSARAPIMLVSYTEFTLRPTSALLNLYREMMTVGIDMRQIKKPTKARVTRSLGNQWGKNRLKFDMVEPFLEPLEEVVLSARGRSIWNALQDGCVSCLESQFPRWNSQKWETQSKSMTSRHSQAYACWASDTSATGVRAMKVLAASILQFDSSRDLIALLPEDARAVQLRKTLEAQGWKVKTTHLSGQELASSKVTKKFLIPSIAAYEKVLFIHMNSLILRPLDDFFAIETIFSYLGPSKQFTFVNYGDIPTPETIMKISEAVNVVTSSNVINMYYSDLISSACDQMEKLDGNTKVVFWGSADSFATTSSSCIKPWHKEIHALLEEKSLLGKWVQQWLFLDAITGRSNELKVN